MSRDKTGDGCCSATCRCMFGYFPWVPLIGCTAVSVFMVFWKLWMDPLAGKTKAFLVTSGIRNNIAEDFLDRTTLITSVILIVTLIVMVALLLLSIFKGHQRALHDAVYGQGQMPTRYYWLHLFFGMLLSFLLYVLIIIFIAILVGLTLWLAGAIAAQAAVNTAARVYTSNANHAMALDNTNAMLSNELQKLQRSFTEQDGTLVNNALQTFLAETQNITYPLQGECKVGCLDLSILSDSVDVKGTCKCSRNELFKMGRMANDLRRGLLMSMGSIGLAIGTALFLLMNISSRITDSKRDLHDIQSPDVVPELKAVDEEAARLQDTGSKQSAYTNTSSSSTRRIMPVAASPEKAHTPLTQTIEPRTSPAIDAYTHSHNHSSSNSSFPSSAEYGSQHMALPPSNMRAAQPPHNAYTPAGNNAYGAAVNKAYAPAATNSYTGHAPASWEPQAGTSSPAVPSGSNVRASGGRVDLLDGWKAVAAKYERGEA